MPLEWTEASLLFQCLIPLVVAAGESSDSYQPFILSVYNVLAVIAGVYTVGNIGRETVSFKYCCIGAYIGLIFLLSDESAISV